MEPAVVSEGFEVVFLVGREIGTESFMGGGVVEGRSHLAEVEDGSVRVPLVVKVEVPFVLF